MFAAERLRPDETTVPLLEGGKTRIGRLWVYVRDYRPLAGVGPPMAAYFYSPDRSGKHPDEHQACYAGLMQVDAHTALGDNCGGRSRAETRRQ